MARDYVFRQIDDVVLLSHSRNKPSLGEWEAWMAHGATMPDVGRVKVLTFTAGGAPDALQRRMLESLMVQLGLGGSRTAVISDLRSVLGVVTVISWFNPKIRAFSQRRLAAAFDYLEIEAGHRTPLLTTAADLLAQLKQTA